MRQIEALSLSTCRHMIIENIDFVTESELELLKKISSFGKFSIKHFLIKDDCLRVEEYIPSKNDHVEECKSLHPSHNFDVPQISVTEEQPLHKPELIEKSCIDLTTGAGRHKIVKIREVGSSNGKSKHNKQITIATTTQTSTQTEPSHYHHYRDSRDTSHTPHKHIETAHNVNGLPSVPASMGDKVLKNISNLTLSNGNGTINLRNISNVTINNPCNRLKEHYCTSTTNIPKETSDCGFYDRLITENKQIQYQMVKNGCGRKVTTRSVTSPVSSLEHVQVETIGPDHIPVKYESNTTISNREHPVEVQQWLKQIVYETETEPAHNTEFLEYVNIKN